MGGWLGSGLGGWMGRLGGGMGGWLGIGWETSDWLSCWLDGWLGVCWVAG
jgi:hypothetical protein